VSMSTKAERLQQFTIVGAGVGRTGTTSLKEALEFLGFGPCYHMLEVFKYNEHYIWKSVADLKAQGRPVE